MQAFVDGQHAAADHFCADVSQRGLEPGRCTLRSDRPGLASPCCWQHRRALAQAAKRGYRDTPLSSSGSWKKSTWLYHELSLDTANASRVTLQQLESTATCAIDLLNVTPGLSALISSPTSCIASCYALAGSCEPFDGCDRQTKPGFILVRKVAALAHAATAAVDARPILWLDFDVAPIHEPDVHFWAFVRSHDVTYLPFTSHDGSRGRTEAYAEAARRGYDQPLHSLSDLTRFPAAWSIDTGLLGLVAIRRKLPHTRALVAAATALRWRRSGARGTLRRCVF